MYNLLKQLLNYIYNLINDDMNGKRAIIKRGIDGRDYVVYVSEDELRHLMRPDEPKESVLDKIKNKLTALYRWLLRIGDRYNVR
jgi:hypothetical protein